MLQYKRLIDISQPIKSDSAAFPGDTPYKRELVLSYEKSKLVNLTRLTMSPHIGTHVDAPSHIKGDMTVASDLVGNMPLGSFIGPALVIDISPHREGITWSSVEPRLKKARQLPERVLFRTQEIIRYEAFEDEYSFSRLNWWASSAGRGIRLMGIDAPSVDQVRSKTLDAHHELDRHGMTWLENLDLSQVRDGEFFLIALPIKFMELEASPVRAVLLEF